MAGQEGPTVPDSQSPASLRIFNEEFSLRFELTLKHNKFN